MISISPFGFTGLKMNPCSLSSLLHASHLLIGALHLSVYPSTSLALNLSCAGEPPAKVPSKTRVKQALREEMMLSWILSVKMLN